jgi:putative chitinase
MAENIDLLKLKLEERRLDEEIELKKRELELREREMDFQLKQSEETRRSKGFMAQAFSPVGVAVIVALFGLLGTTANLWNTAQIEDNKRQAELFLKWYERNDGKDEKQRILELLNLKEFGYLKIPAKTEAELRKKIGLDKDDPVPPPSFVPVPKTADEEKKFFDRYTAEFGSISEETKSALTQIFKFLKDEKDIKNINLVAYLLATIKWETNNKFQPITEYGSDEYIIRKYGANTATGKRLGNTEEGDALRYKGRGYFQIEGKSNYQKFSDALNLTGTDQDLVKYPEKALDPQIAFRVYLYIIQNQTFRGQKISEFINDNKTDYLNARRVVNGDDNSAEKIAAIATKFEAILRESLSTN